MGSGSLFSLSGEYYMSNYLNWYDVKKLFKSRKIM